MQGSWDRRRMVAVAAGGASGAAVRWAVTTAIAAGAFPWALLAINVGGSIILGVLLAEEWIHPRARLALHDFGGIGFCGGLTTFSTFSLEVVHLARNGSVASAALYAAVSVVAAIAGVVAGAAALRRVRSLTLPLEQTP